MKAAQRPLFGRDRDSGVVAHLIETGATRSKSGTLKENPLVALYGPGPKDKRCRDCAHLLRYKMGSTWFKCDLRRNTSSTATDHRAGWHSCAKYEPEGFDGSERAIG